MFLIIALLRIALSAIFGIAGVTKLIDQRGTREAVENFGAPKLLAPAIALVLPLFELTIAAGLLFSSTTWWSASGALLLLLLFIVAISINLSRGRTHDCHCFGQLHSRPLGWPTLARNMIFALGAGIVLWGGRETQSHIVSTVGDALARLTMGQSLLLMAAILIAAAFLVVLQRRQASAQKAAAEVRSGLPVGAVAPEFDLPAYEGGRKSLSQLLGLGKPVLLIFTNPHCRPCVVLFEEIREWQDVHNDHLTIALITLGTIKDNFVNVARNRLGQVLLQEKREVSEKYGATATPTAVVVSTGGRIASAVVGGAEDIRGLLNTLVQNPQQPRVEDSHRPGPVEQFRPEADAQI